MSISADTRERIIRAGQRRFALHGYDKTTNKDIADEAGLTTGALYHYFDSKQSLFVAVLVEEDARVLEGFEEAVVGVEGAVARLHAVLDRAVELHRDDESLSKFVAVAPIEIDRHPEFQGLIADAMPRGAHTVRHFFDEIVAAGQASGELDPSVKHSAVVNMLLSVTQGLAQLAGLVGDPVAHARAIDAFKRLLDGTLVVGNQPPLSQGDGRRQRRPPLHAR